MFVSTFFSPVWNQCSECSKCRFPADTNTSVELSNDHCSGTAKRYVDCVPCNTFLAGLYDLSDTVACSELGTTVVTTKFCQVGHYIARVALTKSGQYGVTVNLGGIGLRDSVFLMQIVPNEPYGPLSSIDATNVSLSVATAGLTHSFIISSFDAYANFVAAGVQDIVFQLEVLDALNVSYSKHLSRPLGLGRFLMTYTLTVAARYTAVVTIGASRVHIRGSPFAFRVLPAIVNAAASYAINSGISLSTAGVPTSFHIVTRDRFWNAKTFGSGAIWDVAIDPRPPGNQTHAVSVTDTRNGIFIVTYVITTSAQFTFAITLQSDPLMSSPLTVKVVPGFAAAAAIKVRGRNVRHAVAGDVAHLVLDSFDQFGNRRSVGGALFSLQLNGGWTEAPDGSEHERVQGIVGEVQDVGNGSYTARYLSTTSGAFLMRIHITSGDEIMREISSSPFTVNIEAGELDPSRCSLYGESVLEREAGFQAVQVLGKDRFGNPLTRPTADAHRFVIALQWVEAPIFGAASDGASGTFNVTFTATIAGWYTMSVLIQSTHIASSPFALQIIPAASHLVLFSASFPPVRYCHPFLGTVTRCQMTERYATAGDLTTFTVFARDRYSNVRTSADMELEAVVKGAAFGIHTSRLGNITDNSDGTLTVSMLLTISGSYVMHIRQRGTELNIRDSPFNFTAGATELYPPHCFAVGQGVASGAAGVDTTFTIQGVDVFGNMRETGIYDATRLRFIGEFFQTNIDIVGPPTVFPLFVRVHDTLLGMYDVAYQVTAAGLYRVSVFKTNRVGNVFTSVHISASPFLASIVPGPASAFTGVVYGASLANAIAGSEATFYLQTYDYYGNRRTSGSDHVFGSVVTRMTREVTDIANVNCSVVNHGSGNYSLSYVVTVTGQYLLSVKLGGQHVGAARKIRSPIRIVCSPNTLDALMTDISGEGASYCTVGRESMFMLNPRDTFGEQPLSSNWVMCAMLKRGVSNHPMVT